VRDIVETYEYRRILEGFTTEKVAQSSSREQIEELKQIIAPETDPNAELSAILRATRPLVTTAWERSQTSVGCSSSSSGCTNARARRTAVGVRHHFARVAPGADVPVIPMMGKGVGGKIARPASRRRFDSFRTDLTEILYQRDRYRVTRRTRSTRQATFGVVPSPDLSIGRPARIAGPGRAAASSSESLDADRSPAV
jgi:hypothetical protein